MGGGFQWGQGGQYCLGELSSYATTGSAWIGRVVVVLIQAPSALGCQWKDGRVVARQNK